MDPRLPDFGSACAETHAEGGENHEDKLSTGKTQTFQRTVHGLFYRAITRETNLRTGKATQPSLSVPRFRVISVFRVPIVSVAFVSRSLSFFMVASWPQPIGIFRCLGWSAHEYFGLLVVRFLLLVSWAWVFLDHSVERWFALWFFV